MGPTRRDPTDGTHPPTPITPSQDWNDYYVVTAQGVGSWCGAYYLALIVCGNYLVLNLVVAVVIVGHHGSNWRPGQRRWAADANGPL